MPCWQKAQRLKSKSSEFERLKELLLADERKQLKKLESKVETLEFEAQDDTVIMKRVTPAISKGIASNKDTMIDALYPIMGGMISKYVTQAIREMIESINQKIENGLSFESYKRKAKAKIAGVSESEILIKESSEATISSLFLIQKESSLLIAEAHLKNQEIDNAHMVASMASAIKDFVNDWAKNTESDDEVQILSYGNATLYIESAGTVFIVAFLDAEPPYEQRKEINTFFASILQEYAVFFQKFDGDDSTDEVSTLSKKIETYLNKHSQKNKILKETTPKRNSSKYVFIFLGLLLLGYGAYLLNTRYTTYKLERMVYTHIGEHISIDKQKDMLILEGQISSLSQIDKIHTLLSNEAKKSRIQDNLSVPLSSLEEHFDMVAKSNTKTFKNLDKKMQLLEKNFTASIDILQKKTSKLNQLLRKSETEHARIVKRKDKEISALATSKEKLKKILAVTSEIYQKLDQTLEGSPFYSQTEHALDFRTLNIFKANMVEYDKGAVEIIAKTFEIYMGVLIKYRDYIETIQIEEHSDNSGIESENRLLSEKRALSIKNYLEELGIIKKNHMQKYIVTKAYGSFQVVMRDGIEDKNASRRVRIIFTLNEKKITEKLRKILDD